jgi:hypothetical protein
MDKYGFTDLFNEFGVEYINVTEEAWQGRIANPQQVWKAVEAKFSPVFTAKLYGCVPKKRFDLQGSTCVSVAKVKHYASFTLKDVLGLVPDPSERGGMGRTTNGLIRASVTLTKSMRHFSTCMVSATCCVTPLPAIPRASLENLEWSTTSLKT